MSRPITLVAERRPQSPTPGLPPRRRLLPVSGGCVKTRTRSEIDKYSKHKTPARSVEGREGNELCTVGGTSFSDVGIRQSRSTRVTLSVHAVLSKRERPAGGRCHFV